MVKRYVFLWGLLSSVVAYSQSVGVNTDSPNPDYQLDVNGEMMVEKDQNQPEKSGYLVQDNNQQILNGFENLVISKAENSDGEVKRMEANIGRVAPVTVVNLTINNVAGTRVQLNTGLSPDEYVVYMPYPSADFSGEVAGVQEGSGRNQYPTQESVVKIVNNQYVIFLSYGNSPLQPNNNSWKCKLVILKRPLVQTLPSE